MPLHIITNLIYDDKRKMDRQPYIGRSRDRAQRDEGFAPAALDREPGGVYNGIKGVDARVPPRRKAIEGSREGEAMDRQPITAQDAPAAIGAYAQGIFAGDYLFTSGQLGIDPQTGALAEGVEGQAEQSMKNIGAILVSAGMSYANIVKTTVFIKNMSDFAAVNAVYGRFFSGAYPARSCVEVAALPKGGLVEIECVAMR